MRKLISSLACVLISVLAFAEPKTIYVDQNVKVPGDGTSWKTAVKTIQEGVNKASETEVDTVLVAPGEYADDLGDYGSDTFCYRVKLDRKVILKSSEGKEVTHIVGRRGNGSGGAVAGLPPVTCVYIPAAGRGSIVEGFTIRDGETSSGIGSANRSAGVGDPTMTGNSNYSSNKNPDAFWYVAYCTISNCCAARGSAVSGGTLIGTVITDNASYENNIVATTYVHAYNCVFSRNATNAKMGAQAYVLVNCMVVNDGSQRGMTGVSASDGGSRFYNSAIFNEWSSSSGDWQTPLCSYCLVDCDAKGDAFVHADSDHVMTIPTTDTYTNLVMSVFTGDWRPVENGRLDGKGNKDALDLSFIPAAYAKRDFDGKQLADDAQIPIGVILPSAKPATAGLVLSSVGMKINGRTISRAKHVHYADEWPSVVNFSAADGEEDLFVGINVPAYASEVAYGKCRGKYTTVALTLPPCEDADGNVLPTMTVTKLSAKAEHVIWVDDDASFEGSPDGSFGKPYRTLQDAVDAAEAVEDRPLHLINVREGTYKTGGKVDSTGLKARVVISAKGNFVMRGVDGADKTFVEGEPDSGTLEDATNPGIGPNACRCVYADASATVSFVDLTFRKGYGGLTAKTGSGGALYCEDAAKQQAYDCIFTDNHIVRENASAGVQLQGSCCRFGWLVRCIFKDNLNYNRGLIMKSKATACQFVHNARGCADNANAERYCWQEGDVYLATVYEPDFKKYSASFNTTAGAENCVIIGGDLVASNEKTALHWFNNIGYDFKSSNSHLPAEIRMADPWLASVENGDFHPLVDSPIVGYAEFSKVAALLGSRLKNICTDFENKSVFAPDGKITIGAFATVHEKSNVYVDATNGNDDHDGLTEATAKKTLAAAVDVLCRKDRIVALPGVYKDGSMIHSVISSGIRKTLTVRARVVVPDYSELVALGSAEETIIEGAADPNPTGTDDEIAHGLGPNAIRGVVLGEGSVLRGFTVTKGHTRGYDETEDFSDNVNGAGVLGRAIDSSRVEDCILCENKGSCGGAGAYVTFVRCRILGNVATKLGPAFRYGSAIDSFIDGNRGERICERVRDAIGCTFGADNLRLDGTRGTMTVCNPSPSLSARIWNVLSYAPVSGANQVYNGDICNCVFPKGAQFTEYSTLSDVNTDYDADELKGLYEAGVPKTLKAPSVDEGYANDLQGTTDATGVMPRICNAVIDIGCYEADWKPQYAKDLGGKRATVTAATSNVRDIGGTVMLGDGAMIALDLAPAGAPVKIAFTVTDGTLTVMRNGQSLGAYTTGQTLSISDVSDLESFAFSYTGTGSAALACCKAQPGIVLMVR